MKYRFSDYLSVIPFDDEQYLLAHGVTGEISFISKNKFEQAGDCLNSEASAEVQELKNSFRKRSITVPLDFDEQNSVRQICELVAKNWTAANTLTLALTGRCNFGCIYCLESHQPQADMSCRVIDKSLDQLFSEVLERKFSHIKLSFYGGEPLLCPDKIEYAVKKVRNFCRGSKKSCSFQITTNGSLFNQKIARLFSAEKDLDATGISIDGPREIHDLRRPFKNGKGSFDRILKNLPLIMATSKKVGVRINVDRQNLEHIPALLDQLKPYSGKNLFLDFMRVTNWHGTGKGRPEAMGEEEFFKISFNLKRLAVDMGLMKSPCSQKNFNFGANCLRCCGSIAAPGLIDPRGDIYCCSDFMGVKGLKIGNVFSGIDEEKRKELLRHNIINNERCLKCKHIFFCTGPCLAMKIFTGDDRRAFCDHFEEILVDWIKTFQK